MRLRRHIIIRVLLDGNGRKLKAIHIPWCVYTYLSFVQQIISLSPLDLKNKNKYKNNQESNQLGEALTYRVPLKFPSQVLGEAHTLCLVEALTYLQNTGKVAQRSTQKREFRHAIHFDMNLTLTYDLDGMKVIFLTIRAFQVTQKYALFSYDNV